VEAGKQVTNQCIWHVVASIPAGYVSTYGDIARFAGLGRAARKVGWALRQLPSDTRIPWHRVINSAGTLSLPGDSAAGVVQRQRLCNEGVPLLNGNRVRLTEHRWMPEAGPGQRPA
jgi:methylated-DNA-protein-cysteine methyltransferase related protein